MYTTKVDIRSIMNCRGVLDSGIQIYSTVIVAHSYVNNQFGKYLSLHVVPAIFQNYNY